MNRDGSYNICPICVDLDSDCPLCPCGKHAVLFGADTQRCLDCADPCASCNEPCAKGADLCEPCAAELEQAPTLRPEALGAA